jgi:hypothetical protein
MKTQKFFIILAIFMVVSFVSSSQTRQQRKALKRVITEATVLKKELVRLEHKLSIYDTVLICSLKKKIDDNIVSRNGSFEDLAKYSKQSKKLDEKLQLMRQCLIDKNVEIEAIRNRLQKLNVYRLVLVDKVINNVIDDAFPEEMLSREARRRCRSNKVESQEIQVQREWLGVKKLASTPVKADQTKGYLGMLIWNVPIERDTMKVVTFKIYDKNCRIESLAVSCKTGELVEAYLLPGNYICKAYYGSEMLGMRNFKVGPELNNWGKKTYHWYNYYNKPITSRRIYK